MIKIDTLDDLHWLRESVDLECKLAGGRDGQGAVPEDFWKTYSAFANTNGGIVILGLRETKGAFSIEGIRSPAKVRKDLFDGLNNPQKVSVNLLNDARVKELSLDGQTLLVIDVPRAPRESRPVHLAGTPFKNTYRRLNESDCPYSDEAVRRLLAERVEESRDSRILKGYGFDDLCAESFRAYRQMFANRAPNHPFNPLDDLTFLRRLGGFAKDRETGDEGLTAAGLLMFGWMHTIKEAFPYYLLDYQERPESKSEQRWIDRLTLDGTWSGNLLISTVKCT